MKKYLSILRIGWLDAIEYRTEFFVSVFSWGIRLVIAVFLWLAVAEANKGVIGGYTFRQILSYFFLVQIISSFTFSRVGFDIAHDIYRGDFGNFLMKPVHYLILRLFHEMSKNAFRTIIAVAIFGGILALALPSITFHVWKIPVALLAISGAYLLNFLIVCIIAISAFWITNSTRLMFIYFGILTIFSGMIFPIDLFPEKFQAVIAGLPFQYIFFFPAKVLQADSFSGHFNVSLGIQWSYVVGLAILTQLIYRLGIRRFEAVGR